MALMEMDDPDVKNIGVYHYYPRTDECQSLLELEALGVPNAMQEVIESTSFIDDSLELDTEHPLLSKLPISLSAN